MLSLWASIIAECANKLPKLCNFLSNQTYYLNVGVAMPGPLNYIDGISLIKGLRKYDNLYGVNIK